MIVLLLFYTYRTKEDLELEGSYWNRYQHALAENKISPKCLEVLQNIQDVCHNCSKLKSARDEIESSTVYESHENDQREQSPDDKLNLVSFDEISERTIKFPFSSGFHPHLIKVDIFCGEAKTI